MQSDLPRDSRLFELVGHELRVLVILGVLILSCWTMHTIDAAHEVRATRITLFKAIWPDNLDREQV